MNMRGKTKYFIIVLLLGLAISSLVGFSSWNIHVQEVVQSPFKYVDESASTNPILEEYVTIKGYQPDGKTAIDAPLYKTTDQTGKSTKNADGDDKTYVTVTGYPYTVTVNGGDTQAENTTEQTTWSEWAKNGLKFSYTYYQTGDYIASKDDTTKKTVWTYTAYDGKVIEVGTDAPKNAGGYVCVVTAITTENATDAAKTAAENLNIAQKTVNGQKFEKCAAIIEFVIRQQDTTATNAQYVYREKNNDEQTVQSLSARSTAPYKTIKTTANANETASAQAETTTENGDTIIASTDTTFTYGGQKYQLTITANFATTTPVLNGDDVKIAFDFPDGFNADGNEHRAIARIVNVDGGEENPNYNLVNPFATYKINKRYVKISQWNDLSGLVYNGNEQKPTIDLESYDETNQTGVAVGDDVQVKAVGFDVENNKPTAKETWINAGTYKVTAVLYGNHSDNYEIVYVGNEDTVKDFTITAREITVNIEDKSSTYGDSIAALAATTDDSVASTDGLYNIISLSVKDSNGNELTATSSAGAYPIEGTKKTEGVALNYTVKFSGSFESDKEKGTYTVNKRKITVTIDNKTSVYGNSLQDLTATTDDAVANTDGLDTIFKLSTTAQSKSTVGEYPITLTQTGSKTGNYTVNFENSTYTITAREITVKIEDKSSTYGDSIAALAATTDDEVAIQDGLYNIISLSVKDSNGNELTATSSAGAYPIEGTKKTEGVALNYTVKFSGSFENDKEKGTYTVNRAEIDVTYDVYSGIYDGAAHDVLSAISVTTVNDQSYEIKYKLSTENDYTTTAPTIKNAGTVTFSVQITAPNHNVWTKDFEANIGKAKLTVTAQSQSITKGETPSTDNSAVTYSGFVKNEDISVLSGTLTFTFKDSDGNKVTDFSTVTETTTFTIEVSGLQSDNYDFSYVDGTLTVNTQGTVELPSPNGTIFTENADGVYTVTYDGTSKTLITENERYTISAESTNTQTDANKDGEVYTVTVTPVKDYVWTTSAPDDYANTNNPYTFTWKIEKREITVTIEDKSSAYGSDIVELTYRITSELGIASTDTASEIFALSTTATKTSSVKGSPYPITGVANGTQANNYAVTFVDGKYTINKADFSSVAVTTYNDVYDGDSHSLFTLIVVTATGETITVNDDTSLANSGLTVKILLSGNWQTIGENDIVWPKYTNAYTLDVSVKVSDANHKESEPTDTNKAEIKKKEVTLTWSNLAVSYNGGTQKPSATYVDVNGKTVSATVKLNKEAINVGEYTATASTSDNNYYIKNNTEKFIIKQAIPTASVTIIGTNPRATGIIEHGDTLKVDSITVIGINNSTLNYTYSLSSNTAIYQGSKITETQIITVTITPDNQNYTTVTVDVPINVSAVAVIGNTYYGTIESALSAAASGNTVYVLVGKNPIIRNNCEVKSGVTLCLPLDDSDTANWSSREGTNNSFADADATNVNKYLKNNVVLNDNVTLTVVGTLNIGGILGSTATGLSGHTSGNYCQILMMDGSRITSSGKIDCFGYIKTYEKDTNATIEATAGSIYAPFVIYDYRGGSSTVGSYAKNGTSYTAMYISPSSIEPNIFPFSVFDVPNIHSTLKINRGATLFGYADLYTNAVSMDIKITTVNIPAQHNLTVTTLISSSAAVINLSNNSSYAECKYTPKDWDKTRGGYSSSSNTTNDNRTVVKLYNGASLGYLTLVTTVLGKDINIKTSSVLFPISWKYDIHLYDGAYVIGYDVKFLTGASLTVEQNTTLDINSKCVFYKAFNDVSFGGSVYPSKNAAQFNVYGTVNINSNASFGGTITAASSDAILEIANGATLSTSSSEGYGTKNGLDTVYNETNNITETLNGNLINGNPNADGTISSFRTNLLSGTYNSVAVDNNGNYAWYTTGSYTITYDTQAEDITVPNRQTATKGKPLADNILPSLSRRGYTFLGWYTEKIGGISAAQNAFYEDITFYAQWEAVEYTLTFNADGVVENPTEQIVTYDDKTYGEKLPTVTEPDGYSFIGWFDEYGNQFKPTDTITITFDTKLKAKWQVRITLNANDSEDAPAIGDTTAKWFDKGANVTDLPTLTRTRYIHKGWSDTLNGAVIGSDYTVTANEPLILYACWKEKTTTIYLTFNYNYSDSVSKENIEWSADEDLTEIATRAGYSFDGWYDSENGGNKVTNISTYKESKGESIVEGECLTLYAHWTAITYKVYLEGNEGSVTGAETDGEGKYYIEVDYDSATFANLTNITVTRTGYSFVGWLYGIDNFGTSQAEYTDKKVSDYFGMNGITEITLVAQWSTKQYTVKFVSDNSDYTWNKEMALKQSYGTILDLSACVPDDDNGNKFDTSGIDYDVTKTKYFIGWKCNAGDSDTVYTDTYTIPDCDNETITFTAQWKEKVKLTVKIKSERLNNYKLLTTVVVRYSINTSQEQVTITCESDGWSSNSDTKYFYFMPLQNFSITATATKTQLYGGSATSSGSITSSDLNLNTDYMATQDYTITITGKK